MLITQHWLRLMKRYIGKSGKLQSRLGPPICMSTYMSLMVGHSTGRSNTSDHNWMDFQLESRRSEASTGWWCEHRGGKSYPLRAEKADALPRSSLPLPHTGWLVGRSFAIHSPHGSFSVCHECMSLRCWTPGSAANYVPTTRPVLVAWYGHTDAETNSQLQMMHPTQRHSSQSTNSAYHCHCSFGTAIHGFHKQWDDYGARPTTKCGKCFGLLWSLYETPHGLHNPWPNCKDCCYVSVTSVPEHNWLASM